MLASSEGGHGFDPRPGHIKDVKTDMPCFSLKHAVFEGIDWLAWSQSNSKDEVKSLI